MGNQESSDQNKVANLLDRRLRMWCAILEDSPLPSKPLILAIFGQRLVKYPSVSTFMSVHPLGRYMTRQGIIPQPGDIVVGYIFGEIMAFTVTDSTLKPMYMWITTEYQ